jgi:SAM-dependent methyltransferase
MLFEVLEHVMKPEVVLREIGRVLEPDSILFLTVPNRFYIFETHGMQICQKQIGNLLGIGIPFFSMVPNFVRRKFERARIYTQAEVISLLMKYDFEPFLIEYLMPPLDIVKQTPFVAAIRKVFLSLSRIPIIRMIGANIMVMSKAGNVTKKSTIK